MCVALARPQLYRDVPGTTPGQRITAGGQDRLTPDNDDRPSKHWRCVSANPRSIGENGQCRYRQNVVARSNDHYGIPNRIFVTNTNKAKSIFKVDLTKVRDEHVRMSLELQQAFGLRREEAIKFIPSYADQDRGATRSA